MVKEPKGRDIGDDDVFTFFHDFTDKQYRIKINSIQMKETEEENKKTNDEVSDSTRQVKRSQQEVGSVSIFMSRK